jgi:hypothetical protein
MVFDLGTRRHRAPVDCDMKGDGIADLGICVGDCFAAEPTSSFDLCTGLRLSTGTSPAIELLLPISVWWLLCRPWTVGACGLGLEFLRRRGYMRTASVYSDLNFLHPPCEFRLRRSVECHYTDLVLPCLEAKKPQPRWKEKPKRNLAAIYLLRQTLNLARRARGLRRRRPARRPQLPQAAAMVARGLHQLHRATGSPKRRT